MNCRRTPGQFRRDMIDVATQDRRQIRVHDRGVAAGDELHQRADLVRCGHLREADASRQVCQPQLVIRIAITVHEHDCAGAHACSERRAQFAFRPPRDRAGRTISPCAPRRSSTSITVSYSIDGSSMRRTKSFGRC